MAVADEPPAAPPGALVLVVRPPLGHGEAAGLCARLRELLTAAEHAGEHGAGPPVICDVSGLTRPDAATLDALARLQLTARRRGRGLWLRRAGPTLRGLIALTGLTEVLPLLEDGGSPLPHDAGEDPPRQGPAGGGPGHGG